MSVNNNQGWMRDCKKRCVVEENMEDHISNLPDDIVGHILSCLPTKDALKTSVLSRAWEKKWTSIYDIDIDDICYTNDMVARFVHNVNKILVGTGTSRIRRFSLDCCIDYCRGLNGAPDLDLWIALRNFESVKIHASDLEAWISCVLKRDVESIEIRVPLAERFDLNCCLLNWTCLKELELCLTCTLVLPVNNCFPNLKRLVLDCDTLGTENFKMKAKGISSENRTILSFPVLEILSLKCCKWMDVNYVEIHAPKLAMFRWLGGSMNNLCLRTPAVFIAEFIGQRLGENLALLQQLKEITCLKLSPVTVMALISLKSRLVFPTFERLTELHIFGPCSIIYILELLQLLPPLEYLYVNVGSSHHGTACQRWPPKIVSVLKKVELGYFHGEEPELTFAVFVLNNARNLVQMSVNVSSLSNITVFTHKLSALKPESSSCKLVVAKQRPQHCFI